jgi:hypothetical protein
MNDEFGKAKEEHKRNNERNDCRRYASFGIRDTHSAFGYGIHPAGNT